MKGNMRGSLSWPIFLVLETCLPHLTTTYTILRVWKEHAKRIRWTVSRVRFSGDERMITRWDLVVVAGCEATARHNIIHIKRYTHTRKRDTRIQCAVLLAWLFYLGIFPHGIVCERVQLLGSSCRHVGADGASGLFAHTLVISICP